MATIYFRQSLEGNLAPSTLAVLRMRIVFSVRRFTVPVLSLSFKQILKFCHFSWNSAYLLLLRVLYAYLKWPFLLNF